MFSLQSGFAKRHLAPRCSLEWKAGEGEEEVYGFLAPSAGIAETE